MKTSLGKKKTGVRDDEVADTSIERTIDWSLCGTLVYSALACLTTIKVGILVYNDVLKRSWYQGSYF